MSNPRHLRVGALNLWVDERGAGPAVLAIAGLGYSSWCWAELQAALSDRCRVIRFDNRGTGRSDQPAGPYSIAMLAQDAAGVLDACALDSAHVIGHSMGGYIAMQLALAEPRKVRTLTLVATTRGGADMTPMPEETAKLWSQTAGLPPPESARRAMPTSFAPGWAQVHPQRFEQLLAARLEYPTPPACWAAQYAACIDYVRKGLDVSGIRCPTLVIHGTADRVVPHGNGETLARQIAGARLVLVEGAGHLLPLEQPERFAALVRQHIDQKIA